MSLVINSQPKDTSFCPGSNAFIDVSVSGTPPISYQWTKGASNISGATTSAYSISNFKIANVDLYSCVFTNVCGTSQTKSFILALSSKPQINISPITQTKVIGDSLVYNLPLVGGTPPFAYQWYKDSEIINRASTNSYKIEFLKLTDGGIYSCVVSNVCGSSTVVTGTLIMTNKGSGTVMGSVLYDNTAQNTNGKYGSISD